MRIGKACAVSAIALFLASFLIGIGRVQGSSMRPSLTEGDLVLIDRATSPGAYSHDDVLVFRPDRTSAIYEKRLIGKPGDVIELRNGILYRNGQVISEEGYTLRDRSSMPPRQVPPGKFLVLGDNRGDSEDSRILGFIDESRTDRLWLRVWPLSRFGPVRR